MDNQKETCYQYLDCKEYQCVMFYLDDSVNCWDIDGTLCFEHSLNEFKKMTKKEFCENCSYYEFRIKMGNLLSS